MARGPKKHLKRVNAPSHWMLDKMGGVYAPRPSTGPHKLRECLPLSVLLRNRFKYALTYAEAKLIVRKRLIKIDRKVRTDQCYPIGFMDVITIEKTKKHYRLLYDTKGRFVPHRIRDEEANFKLCRVKRVQVGPKGTPYAVTHDGRTIRYIHPEVKANDTLKLDLLEGKATDFIKFDNGNLVYITGGHNVGRIGTIVHRERHPGSFEIIHVKDSAGHAFATRMGNVFLIGKGTTPMISLRKEKGVRADIIEDRMARLKKLYA